MTAIRKGPYIAPNVFPEPLSAYRKPTPDDTRALAKKLEHSAGGRTGKARGASVQARVKLAAQHYASEGLGCFAEVGAATAGTPGKDMVFRSGSNAVDFVGWTWRSSMFIPTAFDVKSWSHPTFSRQQMLPKELKRIARQIAWLSTFVGPADRSASWPLGGLLLVNTKLERMFFVTVAELLLPTAVVPLHTASRSGLRGVNYSYHRPSFAFRTPLEVAHGSPELDFLPLLHHHIENR